MVSAFFKQSISVDEQALVFEQLVWEVIGKLKKEGFSFFPNEHPPDRLSMKCDWEMGLFANAVIYLMIVASQELQPYSAKIGSRYINHFNDNLIALSRESLMTLDIADSRSLIPQFQLRVEAYRTAWAQSAESKILCTSYLFSLVIWLLKETDTLDAVDEFLNDYINRPQVMFEPLPLHVEVSVKVNKLLTDMLFIRLMEVGNIAFKNIVEKYQITDT